MRGFMREGSRRPWRVSVQEMDYPVFFPSFAAGGF